MNVRTTVDIPAELHGRLRRQAEARGVSIRSLVVGALEQNYGVKKNRRVTGPMIPAKGSRGASYPSDENPHDLVFS